MNYAPLRFLFLIVLLHQFINIAICESLKEDREDDDNDAMDIMVPNDTNNATCTRRQNSQLHEITTAKHMQFPFMAAIMSQQNDFLCSGTVVSNGLILTTARCSLLPVSYVILNTTRGQKGDGSIILPKTRTEKFPTYVVGESAKDVGLVYTEKHNSSVASKIKLSNNTKTVNVDVEGIGYGLNSEIEQTKELQYVGMEIRSSSDEETQATYFDCVDTKVLICFKDTGGPLLYNNELIGIVIKGQDQCSKMTSDFALNLKMTDFIPTYTFKAWLDEKIKINEEQNPPALSTYPVTPAATRLGKKVHKMTASAGNNESPVIFIVITMLLVIIV